MNAKIEIETIIKDFLQNRLEINFAYIFGSFTISERYKDIDIAVYVNPNHNLNDLKIYPFGYEAEILGNLCLILKTDKIDLIILNKSNLLLSMRVYNSGKLLFERDRFLRIRIVNEIRKEYIDTEKYRKLKEDYLRNYLNVR